LAEQIPIAEDCLHAFIEHVSFFRMLFRPTVNFGWCNLGQEFDWLGRFRWDSGKGTT